MPFLEKNLVVSRVDERRWRLEEPLVYYGRDQVITVPRGHLTDFASVPRSLQWLAPSTGKYTLAAVLHDYLCDNMHEGLALIPVPSAAAYCDPKEVTAREADGLFRRVMREQGVGPVQRWLLWSGVRIGAIRNRDRRPGTLRDVPALLASAAVCAPFILPPLVLIGIARLVCDVAEGLAGWFSEPFTEES